MTVIVCEGTPVAETVIVPLRSVVPVLGLQTTLKLPLLLPCAGLTDSQLRASVTVQAVLEVTVIVCVPPGAL